MTLAEMQNVADVLGIADRACPGCVGDLVEEIQRKFPEFLFKIGACIEELDPEYDPEIEAKRRRILIRVEKA